MARAGRTSAVLGLGAAAALAPGFLLPAEPAPRQTVPAAAEASAPLSAAPRPSAAPAVTVGLGVAAVAAARHRKAKDVRCSRVVRQAERPLRPRDRADGHGWVKEDPDFNAANDAGITATHTVELKKRPSGIKRYTHGLDGKGAMVMDMNEKARYPGDPLGQAAVAGVKKGEWRADAQRARKHQAVDFPVTIEYVEMSPMEKSAAAAPAIPAGAWTPRLSGWSDEETVGTHETGFVAGVT
eukprot:s4722_g7.t1